MQTQLDREMAQVMAALTAPGAMFETQQIQRFGQDLPIIKGAPANLADYFAYFCHQHGDTPFIVDGAQRLSFKEIYAAARTVAGGLVEGYGIKKGDRVALAGRNSASWIVAYMAILMAGGVVTLLNGFWQGEELAEGVCMVDCRYVIADEARASRLNEHPHCAEIVPLLNDLPPLQGLAALLEKGGGASTPLPVLDGNDLATILYTSGSTGKAKGALSDHLGVVQGTFSYLAQTVMALTILTQHGQPPQGQPTTLVNVPLFHVTGEIPVFLQSFALGRKLVLMHRWDVEEAMQLIEQEKVTYFVGVPLMSFEIATHPKRGQYDLSSCSAFASGGAPRPVDHVGRIRNALPHAFPVIGYGLTETNAVGCGNFNENYLNKPGSTGTASRPLVEVEILDEEHQPLPVRSIGEVAIRCAANFVGYWENEAATKDSVTADGFFLSGDLGYLDEEGYLFIVDRKKDIIIRGGENISGAEVEEVIYSHPAIAETSVFGLPDEKFGEIPAAVYLVKPGHSLTDAELAEFLALHLATFKIPAKFWQVSEPLPRLGTEKVDKRALRTRYTEEWRKTGA